MNPINKHTYPFKHNYIKTYRSTASKILCHMPIARQRLGKDIPGITFSTIGHPLLGKGAVNTNS